MSYVDTADTLLLFSNSESLLVWIGFCNLTIRIFQTITSIVYFWQRILFMTDLKCRLIVIFYIVLQPLIRTHSSGIPPVVCPSPRPIFKNISKLVLTRVSEYYSSDFIWINIRFKVWKTGYTIQNKVHWLFLKLQY